MNYYQYKRRAPRRSGLDYIKPFLVILVFLAILVAGWNLLSSYLTGDSQMPTSEKVLLEIETGGAKAMTAADNVWKNIPTSIYLYEGEKVRTQSDGRVTLAFFDENTVRMDKSTELALTGLKKDELSGNIDLTLTEGVLWVNMSMNAGAELSIDTGLLSIRSKTGVFAVAYPGTLYVVQGKAEADIMNDKEIIKNVLVGVGQELLVEEGAVADLAAGLDKEIIFALDDTFKSSNWFRWNRQKDGMEAAPDGLIEEGVDEMVMADGQEDAEVTSDESEDEATSAETEDVGEPAEVLDEEEVADSTADSDAPAKPVIDEPGSNGDTVTLDGLETTISGTVSKDTEAVFVNDYRLSLYKPGSGTFSYYAKVAYKNLEVGDNEYEVIAMDKAGNKSEPSSITLVLPKDVYDTENEESSSDEDTDSDTPAASSTGGVSITAPNGGENFSTSETEFEIKGNVPAGTSKVLVNDYQLQGFKEGDSAFLYRAKSTLGTLTIGAKNTYTAKAYDAEGEVLGSASITIDVESAASGAAAPVITIPSASGSYDTTLNEIVLGGSTGKWVTRIKIDGVNLNEYIPGSEEWKKTVTLSPGANTFKVCAEQAGEDQGCSSITINYQN